MIPVKESGSPKEWEEEITIVVVPEGVEEEVETKDLSPPPEQRSQGRNHRWEIVCMTHKQRDKQMNSD